MYTNRNFKTKKALKDAVAEWVAYDNTRKDFAAQGVSEAMMQGLGHKKVEPVGYYQPGPFGGNVVQTGQITLEGPHSPEPHKWYAEATVEHGKIVKVR